MPVPRIIGVDFDNTIVSYDALIHRLAVERHFIFPNEMKSKKHIRDLIRKRPGGEIEWQKIQAAIYGPRMGEARPIDGVRDFFERCGRSGITLYIVSHKTEFANYDATRTPLRLAAMDWLDKHGFFPSNANSLEPSHVFFASTRQEKIERINRLGCNLFIDDLEETFQEESFPENIIKILYDPHRLYSFRHGIRLCFSWREVTQCVFGTVP